MFSTLVNRWLQSIHEVSVHASTIMHKIFKDLSVVFSQSTTVLHATDTINVLFSLSWMSKQVCTEPAEASSQKFYPDFQYGWWEYN